jgi:hypothetical protein
MFKRKDLNWTSKIPLNAFVLPMTRNVKKKKNISSNTCLNFVCVLCVFCVCVCVCVCVCAVFLKLYC